MGITAGILIGASLSMETLGFYLRGSGIKLGLASIGYSLHVQFATISRIGTFLGLPILGYMADSKVTIEQILLFPVSTSLTFIALCSIVFFYSNFAKKIDSLFIYISKNISRLEIDEALKENIQKHQEKLEKKDELFLIVSGILSHVIIIGGIYSVFILAVIWPEYRATILQISPSLTALGTLISVIYFDPKVSILLDRNINQEKIFNTIIKARISSMGLLFLLALSIYITFKCWK